MDIMLRMGVTDLYSLVIVFHCFISDVICFNVDVDTAVVHHAPKTKRDSYFGYSVALHIDQATSWLLVGAPKAQTNQPDIDRGGSVFRCRIDTQDFCQEIPFDNSGNAKKWSSQKFQHRTIEEKSHQWFGATVQSSGENGMIVACAPRYVYYSALFDKREPVGTCFISRASSTSFQEYSPCKTCLDPSSLSFEKYGTVVRLDKSDANFVDVIHTDAEPLRKLGFGAEKAMGHVDFYPNKGRNQPGCKKNNWRNFGKFLTKGDKGPLSCSHMRAIELFRNSINNCVFYGRACADVDAAVDGDCDREKDPDVVMGLDTTPDTRGVYSLDTSSATPFCK